MLPGDYHVIIFVCVQVWAIANGVQGLLLAMHSVMAPDGLGDHMRSQGWNPGWMCARQDPNLCTYSSSPTSHGALLQI